MKNIIIAFLISFFIILAGCSKNNNLVSPKSNPTGGVTFKIDPKSVPAGVTLITANLTRSGFTSLTQNLNLLSDSSAEVTIPAVPIGTWHLKVDAKDINNTILYSGETDVVVQENSVIQLNLTLNPVSSGTGTISIFVTWGSNSLNRWVDFAANPIMTKSNNPIIPYGISYAKVLYDSGIYKMWYIANYAGGASAIWYAESQNGTNWNTIGTAPVLTAGVQGSWDSYFAIPSVVLKENNLFKMYYMGCNSAYGSISAGLATSVDGIHWDKYANPVIASNSQFYIVGLSDIVKRDSMYYGYFNYATSRTSAYNMIGVATSPNGINWNMYSGNPILIPSLGWEGESIYGPSVIYDNNKFKMIYGNAPVQDAFGMATSTDGFNFVKQSTPIFKTSDAVNKLVQVLYPYYRKFNNVSYIYYTGQSSTADVYICLTKNLGE